MKAKTKRSMEDLVRAERAEILALLAAQMGEAEPDYQTGREARAFERAAREISETLWRMHQEEAGLSPRAGDEL